MKVGDLVRAKAGPGAGKTGLVLREYRQEPSMQNDLLATVDVLWKDGSFQSFVGKRFLEVINNS
jgi:hypothetical protein